MHQGGNDVDVETHRYPFAGDENAHVSLWIVDIETGDSQELPLPEEDGYLVRVAWWPTADGEQRLVAQWVDREQKHLQLIAFDRNDSTVLDRRASRTVDQRLRRRAIAERRIVSLDRPRHPASAIFHYMRPTDQSSAR